MTVVDEIKSRIDIVDLVSETVQLRRSGKNYTGFCPFHANTRTPAFVVFQETGTWRCFGQCNEGGDIFRYVMKKEGWDFSEALHYLAERAGVQLRPPSTQEQDAAEAQDRLQDLLEEVVIYYRHQLLNTLPGKVAKEYLLKRGLRAETIEAFGLGYAPNSWDETLSYFRSKGYSDRDLLDAGMVSERDSGGIYDRFRHRVMFPIRDARGRMAGFGARILNPEDVPKFLNSPQTALFDKGGLLYGLDRARKAIRTLDQVVIVEGYLDVIALHQAGYENAVSPMGTALTEHQLNLIKRYSKRIVLALDPDAAGDKATLRGLQIARQAMDRSSDPVFDARGLLGYEARLQADIRVTTLPEGLDPDDVVNRDPKEWERILEHAKPIVVHVMETLAAGRDLEDAKVKSEIAAQVLPLIEDVPDGVEREAYRQRLARMLRIDERALISERRSTSPRGRRATLRPRIAAAPPETRDESLAHTSLQYRYILEAHCLGVLMRRPDLMYRVDRAMQEYGLPRIGMHDFDQADHQMIFELILESLRQDISEPLNFVLNGLSMPLMDRADELLARTTSMDPVEDRVLEDLIRAFLNLRSQHIHEGLDHLRFLIEDSQEPNSEVETIKQVQQYTLTLKQLQQALGKYTNRVVTTIRGN